MIKKLLAGCLALAMCAGMAGCKPESGTSTASGSGSGEGGGKSLEKYETPLEVSIGMYKAAGNWDMADNEFTKFAKDVLNIQVKAEWELGYEAHVERVKLAISTKSLPDMMLVHDYTLVMQMARAGMLEDLTPAKDYFGDFMKEAYASFDGDACLKDVTIDGKLYALPSTGIRGNQNILWLRKDWLDNVGLSVPTTVEEVYKVAEAFVKNDPDRNGKKDTIGLPFNRWVWGNDNVHGSLDPVFAAYGAFPRRYYKDDSGQIYYGSIQPEMKNALSKVAEQVRAGNINPNTTGANEIAAGKCGMLFGTWWEPQGWLKTSREKDGNAEWIAVNAPLNSDGKYVINDAAPTLEQSGYVVVRKGFANPEAAVKLVNLYYDGLYGNDDESWPWELYTGTTEPIPSFSSAPLGIQLGTRDVVYENYVKYKEWVDSDDHSGLSEAERKSVDAILRWQDDPASVSVDEWADAVSKFEGSRLMKAPEVTYKVPAVFYLPSEFAQTIKSLRDYEDNVFFSIIAEEGISIDSFDEYVTQWKSIGGDQILDYLNENA